MISFDINIISVISPNGVPLYTVKVVQGLYTFNNAFKLHFVLKVMKAHKLGLSFRGLFTKLLQSTIKSGQHCVS